MKSVALERRICHVIFDRACQRQSLALAILAQEPDALGDAGSRRGVPAFDLMDQDPPRGHRRQPEDGAKQRRSARPDQPRDARGSRRDAEPGSPGWPSF